MTILVLETFILMTVLVALGIMMGAGARVMLAGGPEAAVVTAPVADGSDDHRNDDTLIAAVDAAVADVDAPLPPPVPPVEVPPKEFVIDAAKAAVADQTGIRPPALTSPRDNKADDLKLIRGIGPQNEARLNALGIYHFDQISAWTSEEIRWVGSYLAFPGRIEREEWLDQASKLKSANS